MGEIESRKEFITRMFLVMGELPEGRKNDYGTILNFLAFQLRIREADYIKYSVRRVVSGINSLNRLNIADRHKLIGMFEGVFSEMDFMFEPLSEKEKFEFLTSKASREYKEAKGSHDLTDKV